MAFQIENMTGWMSKNKYYTEGGKLPKLKGDCVINGVQYKFAAWAPKEGKKAGFMKFELATEDGGYKKKSENQPAPQPQPEPPKEEVQPLPKKPENRSSLLR